MSLKKRMAKEEQLVLSLSSLYEQYSYEKYSMAKFEEYSFYSDNRKFMPGEGMIAFNSSDGRLMALKPDITLSIVKNAKMSRESRTKLYYNESVFRISDETHDYREIKQTGVEVLGDIDAYAQAELFFLALLSLREIDEDFVLSVSHMGIVAHFVDGLALPVETKKQLIRCFSRKSVHELQSLCQQHEVAESVCDTLTGMLSLSGRLGDVLPALRSLCCQPEMTAAADELAGLYHEIKDHPLADKVIFDASVVNHIDYYNGLIFKGYVKGAPGPVLSGGRYDKLACRIRENACAVGFAVYLDGLNYYYPNQTAKAVDVLVLCEGSAEGLLAKVNALAEQGLRVRVEREQGGIKAEKVYRYEGGKLSDISC
ncbi:MAG: hypothetical protein HFE78_06175 [Clostridiales bacterium]|nr:hypothetical protein [Clostridiales bacterium]